MRAIRFDTTGGPEVLQVVDVPRPEVQPGTVLIRHQAIGVNFIDTYFRTGLYPAPLPCIPGSEAAGIVEAVGEGVTRFEVGDLAAYCIGLGGYAEYGLVAEGRAVKVPAGVEITLAAAALLKGATAEYLLHRTYPVKRGDTILLHAGAGGVGQIAIQWAKALGAQVITTVGSEEKADIARKLGADHVILYRHEDVAARVRAITGGLGVPVGYDSVGKDTFEATLASLSVRGMFVSYGNASGAVEPFSPQRLAAGGSLFFARPRLGDYIATPEELDLSAGRLWAVLRDGTVKIDIAQTFALEDARAAHEALEGRRTVGASLLIP